MDSLINKIEDKSKNNFIESRTATRNHIFNIIFQVPFNNEKEIQLILDEYYKILEDEINEEINQNKNFIPLKINKKIIETQIFKITEKLDEIDKIIDKNCIGWDIKRLDKVDLAILRLAIYEILFEKDIPNIVAINEAVNLSKKYSSEKSYKFINGILANVKKG